MNPAAAFRYRLARVLGGHRPDERTRFETGRLDFSDHILIVHGRRLVATLQPLAWEETIFRRPCWQLHLTLPAMLPALTQPGIIWTRAAGETNLIAALRDGGFAPVAEMANLAMSLTRRIPAVEISGLTIRPALRSEADPVAGIARRMFHADRFHTDPEIPRRFADRAHVEWARNCVRRQVADQTLVAIVANRVVGFHALKWLATPRGPVGLTVLIGLAASARGRGVGKALLAAGLAALRAGGATRAWVRTETANVAAVRLYESFGFHAQAKFWYLRKIN